MKLEWALSRIGSKNIRKVPAAIRRQSPRSMNITHKTPKAEPQTKKNDQNDLTLQQGETKRPEHAKGLELSKQAFPEQKALTSETEKASKIEGQKITNESADLGFNIPPGKRSANVPYQKLKASTPGTEAELRAEKQDKVNKGSAMAIDPQEETAPNNLLHEPVISIDQKKATFQPRHIPFVCPQDTWASRTRCNEVVDDLLRKLGEQRDKNTERPVVLVGYANGGMLIEKALVTASTDQKPLMDSLAGIIFLATPFPGTIAARDNSDTKTRLENSGNKVSLLFRTRYPFKSGQNNAKASKNLLQEFKRKVDDEHLGVVCFYEKRSNFLKVGSSQKTHPFLYERMVRQGLTFSRP